MKHSLMILTILAILSLLLTSCATPQVVQQTVVVEKTVEVKGDGHGQGDGQCPGSSNRGAGRTSHARYVVFLTGRRATSTRQSASASTCKKIHTSP